MENRIVHKAVSISTLSLWAHKAGKKVSILSITTSYNSTVYIINESCSKFLICTGNLRWRRHSMRHIYSHPRCAAL